MSKGNIGYLFYKDYYEEFLYNKVYENGDDIERYFKKKNHKILESSELKNVPLALISTKEYNKLFKQSFNLKTTYPGVLIGSGYNHIISNTNSEDDKKTPKANGEYKIGFQFDYTTGLPIIPGSSIKGLLRSVFYIDDENGTNNDIRRINKEKIEYLNEVLNECKINIKLDDNIYKKLTYEIFEGKIINDDSTITVPMNDRNIFFEAIIDLKITDEMNNGENIELLGEDFITPHNNNPLKEPIPNKFLKVMPNVVWRFQFDLKDNYHIKNNAGEIEEKDYIILSKDLVRIFKRIILDLGIGAKTNVGYGALEECNKRLDKNPKTSIKSSRDEKDNNKLKNNSNSKKDNAQINRKNNNKKNEYYEDSPFAKLKDLFK